MQPLQARVFELRHNLTAYDAMYVALAETLGLPLLTDDAKFGNTPGHHAEIHALPRLTAASGPGCRLADAGREPVRPPPFCGRRRNYPHLKPQGLHASPHRGSAPAEVRDSLHGNAIVSFRG